MARGVAAIIVVLWHCMLALIPHWYDELGGRIWFGLIHGAAAVTFFFVLSGFVLTRGYWLHRNDAKLARSIIKRWPRLAGPVVIATLFAWLLWTLGCFQYEAAASVTHSTWLKNFGGAPVLPPLTFSGAVWEGVYGTFFAGAFNYDTSLWTMRFELYGSFMVFGLILILCLFSSRFKVMPLVPLFIVGLMSWNVSMNYVSFVAGVALAVLVPKRRMTLPRPIVIAMILIGLYGLGYSGRPQGPFMAPYLLFGDQSAYSHCIGAALILLALEIADDGLLKLFSGSIARRLGELSFPIYLLHVPVLLSAGCAVFLWARNWTGADNHGAEFLATAATLIVTVALAWPLARFNGMWLAVLNRLSERLVSDGAVATPAAEETSPAIPAR